MVVKDGKEITDALFLLPHAARRAADHAADVPHVASLYAHARLRSSSAPHNHRTAHTLPTHTLLNLYLLFRKVAISATPPTPLAR